MDHGLFTTIKRLLNRAGFYRKRPGQTHSDGAILAVYFWSVLCDRPVSWACDRAHWPSGLWRGALPSQSCLSRRLRTRTILEAITRIEHAVRPAIPAVIPVAALDGKPLEIALHSGDAQSGKGRGVGHVARGYKFHALLDARGTLISWRLAPLNIDERVIARRLLREAPGLCYVVADANYHATPLFELAHARGVQLVAPRKRSHQGKGWRDDTHAARLRSVELLERRGSGLGAALMNARRSVERFFAQLTNFGGGLTGLPPWVRTYRRTKSWVQAKLIIALLRGSIPTPKKKIVA